MVDIVDIESVFENTFTNKFGFPKERPATKVKGYLMDNVKDFISQSPMMVMATSASDGSCDASPKGGLPGFVKILDDSTLLIPDVAGNNLFQSYINMSENAHVGMVFLIPGIRETVRVNGRVKLIDKEELERLEKWVLPCKTYMHVDDWKELFAEAGYTGDYYWFIAE